MTQSGATPEKETRSEPPTCFRTRTLELARVDPRGSRATRRQQETAPAQATVPRPRKGDGPTAADGARGAPDVEAGAHDGGDDAWHVASPWL